MTTGRPSFFSPFRRSRSTPLALAELDRRLRREAEFVQAPLPTGLARRTLDALQACQRCEFWTGNGGRATAAVIGDTRR